MFFVRGTLREATLSETGLFLLHQILRTHLKQESHSDDNSHEDYRCNIL